MSNIIKDEIEYVSLNEINDIQHSILHIKYPLHIL